ncbi:MAG: hypothetical protein ACRC9T_00905 [Vibrionaceae bacterium]
MEKLRTKLQHQLEIIACRLDHFLYMLKLSASNMPVLESQTMVVSLIQPSKISLFIESLAKKLAVSEQNN